MSLDCVLSAGGYQNLLRQHVHDLSQMDPPEPWPDSAWRNAFGCRECARRVLIMLIKSSEWVTRRVERVSFRDGQTASRQVTVDVMLPQAAPIFRTAGGNQLALVPLTVLRKKTLANFTMTQENGASIPLIGLRWNQALTKQMLLVLGDAINGDRVDDEKLGDLAHKIAEGTQEEIIDAKKYINDLECLPPPPPPDILIWNMFQDVAVKSLIYRFADNFLLLALLDVDGDMQRIVHFSYDEPVSLKYRPTLYMPASAKPAARESAESKQSWRHRALAHVAPWLLPRLGFRPSMISFPTPAAENCQSYHFEITAPSGIQISAASMIAGRPNELDGRPPSWDRVAGGFPVVGLHVWGVPNGSNSIARVGLKLARRGWLSVSTVASLLCTALLFAVAQFPPKPDDDPAVAVVMTVGAAALTFVIRSDEHDMMTRLVTFLRVVAALPLVLLILDGAWVALHRHYLTRPSLYVFAGIALACSVVLTIAYVTAARSEPFVSPWEQGFNVGNYADDDRPQGDYGEIWSQLNFDEAAIVVGSSEGEHFEFVWTEEAQTRLVRRLLELEYDSRKQATPQNALKRSPTR